MTMIDYLTGTIPVTVTETERVLVLRHGRFASMLTAGHYRLRRKGTTLHRYDIEANPAFVSSWCDALKRARPELHKAHLTEVRAEEAEVVLISRDGWPWRLLHPGHRITVWTDAGPWEVERFAVDGPLVPKALGDRLEAATITKAFTPVTVPEAHTGLLFTEGALAGDLPPGLHRLWTVGARSSVTTVDLRWRAHEVTGHEILTRDRVTLRVNLSATYRVVDARRAVSVSKDYAEALHRALALAFRKTLGALSLDELLADKVAVDETAAGEVRTAMAELGLEVAEIALKDVILPGEMREILNRVVAAEKEAEANVIRRREETNAVRALHNTAKVMADNPVMLRLKELEALETVASKVERLTVHNGTAGLLSDLVKLRD
ncbi:slipin family protein [Oceanicola sp. 502str15]|uniref:slipin family protein n=1 Tax=Oceanicola sp. 502str15 TaxID=2696061 RepID=UPI00209628E7|nr:slipin family protein [Oceanicola sp. 502str15]MCO6384755.1 slipin family protein [Oceanicola sp. 502str15]